MFPGLNYKLKSRRAIAAYNPEMKLLYFKWTGLDTWMLSRRVKTDKELKAEALSKLDRSRSRREE